MRIFRVSLYVCLSFLRDMTDGIYSYRRSDYMDKTTNKAGVQENDPGRLGKDT